MRIKNKVQQLFYMNLVHLHSTHLSLQQRLDIRNILKVLKVHTDTITLSIKHISSCACMHACMSK